MGQKKINNIQQILYFSIILVLIILGLISIFAILIKNKQAHVFRESSMNQISRSVNLYLEVKQSILKHTIHDYTFWDEMVSFIEKPDIKWSELNLDPSLKTFQFHGIYVIDTLRKVVYAKNDTLYSQLKDFPLNNNIFQELYKKRFIHTYQYSGDNIIEIHGSTIHPSNDPERKTNPAGYMFFVKVWDTAFMNEFADVTTTTIEITKNKNLQKVPVNNRNEMLIHIPLLTFDNKIIGQLTIRKNVNAFWLFNRFSSTFIVILVIASCLIVLILLYTTSRYINKPLKLIESVLKKPDPKKILELNNYSAEFSQIGKLIQNFLDQKQELISAKEKAEESDRLKSAFLANMSHEIRSPLNGIIGFSDLLSEKENNPEKTQRYANYISGRSKDLLRIINDILDFSRIEAQQLEILNSKFVLNTLWEELTDFYSLTSEKPNRDATTLRLKKGQNIEITTDYLRLKQILINLIDNAFKFTEKGLIEVGFHIKESEVEIYVQDSGIGIPPEKIDIIFDRFRQINETSTRRQGGNGLGLAICKGLVNLMKGSLRVTSESGKGSVFYISLPLNP